MTTADKTTTTTYAMPSDLEVAVTRVFDAPRELVFTAWTDPRHVPQWMTGPAGWTMPVCEIDLRPGGAWHFVWRRTDGSEMAMRGVYREIDRPERLVNTESWGAEWPETLNTLVLTADGDRTVSTLTLLYPSADARDAALATGMKDGLNPTYERLDGYLRTLR